MEHRGSVMHTSWHTGKSRHVATNGAQLPRLGSHRLQQLLSTTVPYQHDTAGEIPRIAVVGEKHRLVQCWLEEQHTRGLPAGPPQRL